MVIGILSIDLHIQFEESVKERRNIVRSIKDMVRKKFNVSIAEIVDDENTGLTHRSKIAAVAVSNDTNYLNSTLSNVFNLIERFYPDIIVSYQTDFMMYE